MLNHLKSLKISNLKKLPAGKYPIGLVPGLYLFKNTNGSSSFVLRYTSPTQCKRRYIGLGSINHVSVKEACDKAIEYKKLISEGIDPIEYKHQQKLQAQSLALQEILSFQKVAMEWHGVRSKGGFFSSLKEEKGTLSMLRRYAFPTLGHLNINEISAKEIKKCLEPIWVTKHHTAEKLKSHLAKILRWATATGQRERDDNPTDLRASLGILLEPYKKKIPEKNHFAKCPVSQIPALMEEIHNHPFSISARAVEFAILTATRSNAVRQAKWNEFDLKKGIWTIDRCNDKIKTHKRDRTIFLSKQAIDLLQKLPKYTESPYVFTKPFGGCLGDDAFRMFIIGLHQNKKAIDGIGWVDDEILENGKPKQITIHGTARSTFKTWSKDDTLGNNRRFDSEAVELCLLHQRDDAYRGAYDRSKLEKERRFVMDEWGKYCYSVIEKTNSKHK